MIHLTCQQFISTFSWKTSYWGDCTKTCNGGVKKRNVRCIQKSGNGVEYSVDLSLCNGRMPPDTEGCNKEPCPSEWIAQPFGEVNICFVCLYVCMLFVGIFIRKRQCDDLFETSHPLSSIKMGGW